MKTCRIVKWLFAVALMLMVNYCAMAQIKPSVYAGIGNYTNLGGTFGIGTEIRYKFVSVNAAIGTAYYHGTFDGLEIVGGTPWLGFDFGVKGYVYKGLFASARGAGARGRPSRKQPSPANPSARNPLGYGLARCLSF